MRIYRKQDVFTEELGLSVRRHRMQHNQPPHVHQFIELVYIADGAGVHGIGGRRYQVHRGALLLINYRQEHFFETQESMAFFNILLDPAWISEKLIGPDNAFELLSLSAFSEFQREIDQEYPLVLFSGEDRARIEELIGAMEEEFRERKRGSETILKAQVNILLTLIFRKMAVDNQDGIPVRLTPEFLQYLKEHCAEKMTLESLARQCFYNPTYFSRLFKEHYGQTLTAFLLQIRVERACSLLRETALSAEAIAEKAGFGNRAAFYRAFRAQMGCTPAQYRNVKRRNKMK